MAGRQLRPHRDSTVDLYDVFLMMTRRDAIVAAIAWSRLLCRMRLACRLPVFSAAGATAQILRRLRFFEDEAV